MEFFANESAKTVCAPLLRALLGDYASGELHSDAGLLHRLEKYGDDPYWNADRPRTELAKQRLHLNARAQPMRIEEDVVGANVIFDALSLSDGNY